MPPKKTKAEEALAFLSDLDNLEAPEDAPSAPPAQAPGRSSTDSNKPGEAETTAAAPDAEAADALAFLEAQINQKRAPLSVPSSAVPTSATPRTSSPALSGSTSTAAAVAHAQPDAQTDAQLNVPTAVPAAGTGWGSFWSSATSAIQSAQRVADEQYRKVREEGVSGVRGQLEQLNVGGVDLNKLRKDAEERLGGIVKNVGNVDLDKLRMSSCVHGLLVWPLSINIPHLLTQKSRPRPPHPSQLYIHSAHQHRRPSYLGARDNRAVALASHGRLRRCGGCDLSRLEHHFGSDGVG